MLKKNKIIKIKNIKKAKIKLINKKQKTRIVQQVIKKSKYSNPYKSKMKLID